MKCRDCDHRGWGDDEGTPVYGFCIMRGSCPDPDIERSCPDFEHKAVYIATSLHTVSREQVEQIKGVWIFNDDWWEFRCSKCHKGIGNIEKYKFCPHCGAPMTDEAVEMLMERMEAVLRGLELYAKHGTIQDHRRRLVYVLTNYGTTMEENLYRIYKLRELDYDPYVMIYDKPSAPKEIKRLQRWCNNRIIFKSCEKFEDYK